MNYISHHSIIMLVVGIFSVGVVAQGQSYNWVPIDSTTSKWLANGTHTYSNNIGSVVLGDNLPSNGMLLDVEGQMGGTEYCNAVGGDCFDAINYRWRSSGNNMYISGSHNVAIGRSSASQDLHVEGSIDATSYLYSSDERLKTNISTAPGLATITQLDGVSFDWIDSDESTLGLIAQDVEQVLPQLVHTDEDGFKSVEYMGMVAVLIQALKEQEQELELLRKEIEAVLD